MASLLNTPLLANKTGTAIASTLYSKAGTPSIYADDIYWGNSWIDNNTNLITSTADLLEYISLLATKASISQGIKVANALVYKGTVSSASSIPTVAEVGDLYIVSEVFDYDSTSLEIGDMLICYESSPSLKWNYIQTNIVLRNLTFTDGENSLVFNNSQNAYIKSGDGLNVVLSKTTEDNDTLTISHNVVGGLPNATNEELYKFKYDKHGHVTSVSAWSPNTITVNGKSYNPLSTNLTVEFDGKGGIKINNEDPLSLFGVSKNEDSITTLNLSTESNRYYKIESDKDGNLVVNVPWTDSLSLVSLLGTSSIGSTKKGVYWNGSTFIPCSYEVNIDVPSDAKFTDTWIANALNVAGYVSAPKSTDTNKVWKTDSNGNPGWRDDSNVNTWRPIYGYSTTASSLLLSSSTGTSNLNFSLEFIYVESDSGMTGSEFHIAWAEIDALGLITYTY